MRKNGIHAFMDDEELRVGEEIGGELLRAIDDSQIYVPIFSENYASRKWCLRELVRMVDNVSKSKEKKILPIFYYVKPDDVDLKTESYRKAIGELKKEHKKKQQEKSPHEVECWEGEFWEKALTKVGKIKGWVLQQGESQAKFVDSIVVEVLQELRLREKSETRDLVGLDDRVAKVLELLDVNCSNEVRLLGIHGMGGIGKTTLARVVYSELLSHFGKNCAFFDDIRETFNRKGLVSLQKKLLKGIHSTAAKIIQGVDDGRKNIERKLSNEKFLIVLDDVGVENQIENLIGQGQFYPGTRIIITTRNTGILETIEKMKLKNSKILAYEMAEMKFSHALQLFKRHAILEGSLVRNVDDLSIHIVDTTGRLPLALKVIGSSLCGKPNNIWEITLKQLKKIPNAQVQEKLRISFNALNDHERHIFLDIACFFINEDITNASYMWEACGFYLDIEVLVRKSLIKITNNKFWMHDQLRDLGREIVRQENPKNVGKRSRVYTDEELIYFVRTEEMKDDVEALDLRRGISDISISHAEIGRFRSLRFLRLSHVTLHGDFIVSLPYLRWISWRSPPPDVSVPSMHSKNLVVLELFHNHFTDESKVWDLIKMATKLKKLTLVKCCGITRTPDLSKCLGLERLAFDNCERLKEIDSSIGKVTCLHDLNIIGCKLIEHVPNEIGGLVKLERFSLRGCYGVSILPTSIGDLASLRKLDLSSTRITILPEFIGKLQCLSDLILEDSRITEIPSKIGGLVELQHLLLDSKEIKQLPDSIGKLKSLCILNLTSGHRSSSNSNRWELPITIAKLEKLEELHLGNRVELVGKIPDEIRYLSSLRVLDLRCTKICRVPQTINMLSCLSTLILSGCDMITDLPELPTSLVRLYVQSRSLQVVPNLSKLTNLKDLSLSDESENRSLQIVPNLSKLTNLENLSLSDEPENRDSSNLKHKCDLEWIGRLSKLRFLSLYFLNFIAPIPELGHLSLLLKLTLGGLDVQLPRQLPPSLFSVDLHNFNSTELPLSNLKVQSTLRLHSSQLQEIQANGLSELKNLSLFNCELRSLSIPSSLRTLFISSCPNMIEIKFLGMSASLVKLAFFECRSIERIVLCSEVGSLGVLDQSESSAIETTDCSPGVLLLTNAFNKLENLDVQSCENLLEIQVIGTLLSLQVIRICFCNALEKISGLSNLKKLSYVHIQMCPKLWVVEGLDELESLTELFVNCCHSLETLLDISSSKIPDECIIQVSFCSKLQVSYCRNSLDNSLRRSTFKECKRMAQLGAPNSEKNEEEAKMEGDAVESDTEILSPFHSSASSWDHEISEEPSLDDVREGTPSEKQNQTMGEDLNRLDALAPPRTFCDRFKTCLASILECVCNRDFPSVKTEIL